MKKMIFLLSSVALLFACNSGMTPVEYNDKIITEQTKITKLFLEMNNYASIDVEKADSIRGLTVIQCDSSIAVLKGMPDFDGDSKFKNAAINLFQFYKDINQNEYKEMLAILQKEDVVMEDIERMSVIQEQVSSKETGFDSKLEQAQNEFAKKNNIQIAPNAMQNSIDNL